MSTDLAVDAYLFSSHLFIAPFHHILKTHPLNHLLITFSQHIISPSSASGGPVLQARQGVTRRDSCGVGGAEGQGQADQRGLSSLLVNNNDKDNDNDNDKGVGRALSEKWSCESSCHHQSPLIHMNKRTSITTYLSNTRSFQHQASANMNFESARKNPRLVLDDWMNNTKDTRGNSVAYVAYIACWASRCSVPLTTLLFASYSMMLYIL